MVSSRTYPTQERDQVIVQRCLAGETYATIAEDFGIKKQRVQQIFSRHVPGTRKPRRSRPVCAVEGCDETVRGRGWCAKHYQRWQVRGDVQYEYQRRLTTDPICIVAGCERPAVARAQCNLHYYREKFGVRMDAPPARARVGKTPDGQCSVAGCDRRVYLRNLCVTHYRIDLAERSKFGS